MICYPIQSDPYNDDNQSSSSQTLSFELTVTFVMEMMKAKPLELAKGAKDIVRYKNPFGYARRRGVVA